jgi:hypothetical protein
MAKSTTADLAMPPVAGGRHCCKSFIVKRLRQQKGVWMGSFGAE